MAKFALSSLAKEDLREVGRFTLEHWGPQQVVRYLDGFENACQLLAENPNVGRSAAHVRDGLHAYSYQAHVIFYLVNESEILIVRVLHGAQDVPRAFSQQEDG